MTNCDPTKSKGSQVRKHTGQAVPQKPGQAVPHQQLVCSNLNKPVVLSLVFYFQSGVKFSLSAYLIYRQLAYQSTELYHIIH